MVEAGSELGDISNNVEDLNFMVGNLHFFAKRYGVKGGLPVLALHGWMDNSASFKLLAPQLKGCDVLCIDCAGHGFSDHRSHLGAYNIWQDIAEVFCIADQMGWDQFALLGHSRGAICSFLAAGTLPERISHLILMEGLFPPYASAEETPENLATSIKALLASQGRIRRFYDTFEQAVTARVNGFVPVSHQDAIILAEHGTSVCDKGYYWRYDHKLSIGSEIRLSRAQVTAFQKNISVKTLVILAENGMFVNHADFMTALTAFQLACTVVLPGDHHFHMSSQHQVIAQHILNYLFA